MSAPDVSILLPVYNAEAFIGETLESLLGQTFGDFEIIAINDGSTDGSLEILHACADERLSVFDRPNRGLIATLNEGLTLARGALIARMDADDVAMPERLARQVAFLRMHDDVAIVGTQIQPFVSGQDSVLPPSRHPATAEAIACAFVFRSPLAHPTIMFRRGIPGFKYDPAYPHVEDFALWLELTSPSTSPSRGPVVQFANLPQVLLRYRVHAAQVCTAHSAHQRAMAVKLQLAFINRTLGILATASDALIHRALAFNEFSSGDTTFPAAAAAWLARLHKANRETGFFPHEIFASTLTGRLVSALRHAKNLGVPVEPLLSRSPLTRYVHVDVLAEFRG
jgi:glycosyltransferase involved in cell wall biosynthesis